MKKGFTILELLVVIVVLGVFSALALPQVGSWLTDRDVKNIWDRLGLEIDDVKETLLNKFIDLSSGLPNL